MSSSEYNQLLKFLYFEGYADSYEEAENLLEEMSDDEFKELIEAKDIPQEVALAIANKLQGSPKFSRRGKLVSKLRQYAVERNKKRIVKLQQQEELEMQEASSQYRTTASGHRVRWDEDDAIDNAVSDMMQRRRAEASKKAAQQKMKAKGTVPKKGGKDMFESITEYLFIEGYADTIEGAELMAECISEDWMNEIMEAKADSEDPVQRLRDRNERNVDPSIPTGYRTASRRTRHELSRGKKQQKGQKTNYDNLGNMNRSRYRQQQFKRTGNDLYKD